MGEIEGSAAIARRAVELGAVDVKAIRTPLGKVRISMTMSIEQLETLIAEAKADHQSPKRSVTQCNPKSQRREDRDSMMTTRARDPAKSVWVSEGTRAWKRWAEYRDGESIPTTSRDIGGRRHTGWYFPSLFPPPIAAE